MLPRGRAVGTSKLEQPTERHYPVGAELGPTGCSFRVWAPKRSRVEAGVVAAECAASSPALRRTAVDRMPAEVAQLDCAIRFVELRPSSDGYFEGTVDDVVAGDCYGFRLDDSSRLFGDPASRFQPWGPAGLSQVVDATTFRWTDQDWPGIDGEGDVLYEMHIGTFTPEGTWRAAAEQLAELKRAGMTCLEVMPVAEFPGNFGWGYDGVSMFAPTRLYGEPDDFRAFVDRAHAEGLGVILDVVYNHFGNIDNYLGQFSDDYYTNRYQNEWAAAINFEGPTGRPVRNFFVANARYWIEEFHVDGYRFDATQCVYDDSTPYILGEATAAARQAAGNRRCYFLGENEPQDVVHLRPVEHRGSGLDALWNDDFHHSATVRLTGKNPAYYSDYLGCAQELIDCVKRGFLYQGQRSQWQQKPRGTPTSGFSASAFVSFLQNHDQIANSATGERILQLTSPGRYRAMAALWLLAPQTPLFFQGQEYGASTPFLYFADFAGEAAAAVDRGRKDFLAQFPSMRLPEEQALLAHPCDERTFARCRLDPSDRERGGAVYDLHKDLLQLRREDPIFARRRADLIDGVPLSPDAVLLRYFDDGGDDRLLFVNFGGDLFIAPTPQPLLSPPARRGWAPLWSSDHPRYGTEHTPPLETDSGWRIPGEAAIVLNAVAAEKAPAPEAHRRTHAASTIKTER